MARQLHGHYRQAGRHLDPHPRRPPAANGHLENPHKRIIEECWRPTFARYRQLRFSGLQRDLQHFLWTYNYDGSSAARSVASVLAARTQEWTLDIARASWTRAALDRLDGPLSTAR
jgi:hypothetical protein